jgi:hypothetical protein
MKLTTQLVSFSFWYWHDLFLATLASSLQRQLGYHAHRVRQGLHQETNESPASRRHVCPGDERNGIHCRDLKRCVGWRHVVGVSVCIPANQGNP